MANGAAAGKTFLAGVLAKLSAEDRAKGEAALQQLEALGSGAVITAIGDGTLAQGDFSRQSDELRQQSERLETQRQELDQRDQALAEWHSNLTGWYTRNKEIIDSASNGRNPDGTFKPRTPAPTPAPAPQPSGLTEEQFNERMAGERAAFLGFSRDQNQLMREHHTRFGEILDIEPLLRHAQIAQVGLMGVYGLVHKERLDKWQADQQAKHDKEVADKAVQAFRESQHQMPYPTPTGVGSGSPLDALETKGVQPVVDAAVSHYNRLQAERHATGS